MMPDLPPTRLAALSAQFSVTCQSATGNDERHRIWIRRNGSVITPDHAHPTDEVLTALGGTRTDPCSYWLAVHGRDTHEGSASRPPPGIANWTFDHLITSWTTKAVWTADDAIAGARLYATFAPDAALQLTQTFAAHENYPGNVAPFLELLLAPTLRAGGFRRTRSVTPGELDALLHTGLGAEDAVAAAILGISPDLALRGRQETVRLGQPAAILIRLTEVFPPDDAVTLLEQISPTAGAWLAGRLPNVTDPITNMTLDDARAYLFSIVPTPPAPSLSERATNARQFCD